MKFAKRGMPCCRKAAQYDGLPRACVIIFGVKRNGEVMPESTSRVRVVRTGTSSVITSTFAPAASPRRTKSKPSL